jgi:hypothetical protein
VFGLLVAIGDLDRVSDTDIVYVVDFVTDFVNGNVVGIPVFDSVYVAKPV